VPRLWQIPTIPVKRISRGPGGRSTDGGGRFIIIQSMHYLLRQILSILVLPISVAVVIPLWIARRWNVATDWPVTWVE